MRVAVKPMAVVPQLQVAATSFLSLFAIVGLALYGLPFFYDFMVQDFGWTRAQVTSGNALSKVIVRPLFAFAAGWIIDRYGPRRMMLFGLFMAATALVGLGSISSLELFYLFYVFYAIGYVCGGPLPNQVLLSQWFTGSRGKAMGFAYLGVGLGGALVPLLAHWLVRVFGWHTALVALGGLVIVTAVPMVLVLPGLPSPYRGTDRNAKGGSLRDVLMSRSFYLLMIGSMCAAAAVGGTNQHLKLFLSLDRRQPQGEIAAILSLVMAASMVGRLFMGWLADRVRKQHVMLLITLLVASAIPLLLLASIPGLIYVFAVVFGLAFGGAYFIIPLVAADLFGVRALGRLMGIILTADAFADSATPVAVGHLHDLSASYKDGFLLLIVLAILGALAVAMMPGRTRHERMPYDEKESN